MYKKFSITIITVAIFFASPFYVSAYSYWCLNGSDVSIKVILNYKEDCKGPFDVYIGSTQSNIPTWDDALYCPTTGAYSEEQLQDGASAYLQKAKGMSKEDAKKEVDIIGCPKEQAEIFKTCNYGDIQKRNDEEINTPPQQEEIYTPPQQTNTNVGVFFTSDKIFAFVDKLQNIAVPLVALTNTGDNIYGDKIDTGYTTIDELLNKLDKTFDSEIVECKQSLIKVASLDGYTGGGSDGPPDASNTGSGSYQEITTPSVPNNDNKQEVTTPSATNDDNKQEITTPNITNDNKYQLLTFPSISDDNTVDSFSTTPTNPQLDAPTEPTYKHGGYGSGNNQDSNTGVNGQDTNSNTSYTDESLAIDDSFFAKVSAFFNPESEYMPPHYTNNGSGNSSQDGDNPKVSFYDNYEMPYRDNNSYTSDMTFRTDGSGRISAYGVSEEDLDKIFEDIAARSTSVQNATLPDVLTGDDGSFTVEAPDDDTGEVAEVPSWLQTLVQTGGTATVDSSGTYGYVTSQDNKTVDIYEKDEGKFVTIEIDDDGKRKIGIKNKDGKMVFMPVGGLLDSEADWGEVTKAFINIASRIPHQKIDMSGISKTPLTPFDIIVREIYGGDALSAGIEFASTTPEYTIGKNGELIPTEFIEAALDISKELSGVTGLQKSVEDASMGKINITTSAKFLPVDASLELELMRIMPIPQQMLTLAHIRGEMEARGYENIEEELRSVIFNTYDSMAKKVTGIVAFTVRIDEDGNEIGNVKTTFSLGTLITELFATFASATDTKSDLRNFFRKFFGTSVTSSDEVQQNGNMYRIKTDEDTSYAKPGIDNTIWSWFAYIKNMFDWF